MPVAKGPELVKAWSKKRTAKLHGFFYPASVENAPICKANDRLGDILFSAGGRLFLVVGK